MNLSRIDQLALGLILSTAVGLGITARSPESAWSLLIVGGFFMAPSFFGRGLAARNQNVRRLSGLAAFGWAVVLAFGLLLIVERLYYTNAETYPRWLATGKFQAGDSLESLRYGECKERGPIEISEKRDGVYLLRCGNLWHDSKTYIANFNPVRTE